MQLDKLVSIGNPVDLQIQNYDDEIIDVKTMMQDVLSDNTLVVNNPTKAEVAIVLSDDSDIRVEISQDSAGMYVFYAKYLGRIKIDGIPCIKLKPISNIEKFQRRQYFRLGYIGQVNINIDNLLDEIDMYLSDPRVKAKIRKYTLSDKSESHYIIVDGRNLSGGGFRASCRIPLPTGNTIKGEIFLDDEKVNFEGEVVRCKAVENEIGNYEIGVSFLNMDEDKRSKIIAFIFHKQRRMIKRE